MERVEYKHIPIRDLKVSSESMSVEGLFSVYGNIDAYSDRVLPGAFSDMTPSQLRRVKVLWQHNNDMPPIGVIEELYEISRDKLPQPILQDYPDATGGLYARLRFLDTDRGKEIFEGIAQGAITENSIGYTALEWDIATEELPNEMQMLVRNIKKAKLWDISPVIWGANSAAQMIKKAGNVGIEYSRLDALIRLGEYE